MWRYRSLAWRQGVVHFPISNWRHCINPSGLNAIADGILALAERAQRDSFKLGSSMVLVWFIRSMNKNSSSFNHALKNLRWSTLDGVSPWVHTASSLLLQWSRLATQGSGKKHKPPEYEYPCAARTSSGRLPRRKYGFFSRWCDPN